MKLQMKLKQKKNYSRLTLLKKQKDTKLVYPIPTMDTGIDKRQWNFSLLYMDRIDIDLFIYFNSITHIYTLFTVIYIKK